MFLLVHADHQPASGRDVKRLDSSPPTSSFPSGHTGAATALFVAQRAARRVVRPAAAGCGSSASPLLLAVPLLVAYGRLYRGMHHPTDILGAYLNGGICIAIAAGVILARGPLARFASRTVVPTDPREAPGTAGTARCQVKRAAVVYNPTKVTDLAALKKRVEPFMSRTAGSRRSGWRRPRRTPASACASRRSTRAATWSSSAAATAR